MRFDIITIRALRGPNRYSLNKTIFMLLGLKEFEGKTTDSVPGFSNLFLDYLPGLKDSDSADNRKFIKRLESGTDFSDAIIHAAVELQTLAGFPVEFKKIFPTKDKGIYVLVFNYSVEYVGIDAAEEAVILVESIINGKEYYTEDAVYDLKQTRERYRISPTTQYIVDSAAARGIPGIRLKGNYVQLGYGRYQQRIESSITSKTSALAVELADEKYRTKELLHEFCIPVPEGIVVGTFEEAKDAVEELGYPVVVKPEIGNQGRGISVNINDIKELEFAFQSAVRVHQDIIIEEYLTGNDYRVLVIDGKFTAASYREPPFVLGNGISTIGELIDIVNDDPRRGYGHENILTRITVDEMTEHILNSKSLTLDTVLECGVKLYLKTTANLSQGGTATDVTDIVHPSIRLMAERTAMVIGMDVMGIDFIAKDISTSLHEQKAGIIEVNAEPGLRMHIHPSIGKPRNVAEPIIDMLFPVAVRSSIPIIAVTGTNGKTTVCKLIAHTLKYNGSKVGLASTTGVEIDGTGIVKGDYSGPGGHKLVLKDATVDYAVLETARGGILRRGLIYNECDIGILLNVGEDHIGNDLIDSVEDLCDLKSTVVKAVKKDGYSIINADDEIVMNRVKSAGGNTILFSLNPDNKYIESHCKSGGISVIAQNDKIYIRKDGYDDFIANIYEVPITFNGTADFNIANTLAAVGALYGLGMKKEKIKDGILTFYPSIKLNPGRMNVFDFDNFKVILDYGHNKHAMEALSKMLPKLSSGKKIGICHGSGNRQDELLAEFASIMAEAYDYIIITDLDIRNRKLGETAEIVKKGILATGFSEDSLEIILDVHKAVDRAFEIVQSDGIIVVQVDKIQPVIDQVLSKRKNKVFMCSGI